MIGLLVGIWQCYSYIFFDGGIGAERIETLCFAILAEFIIEFAIGSLIAARKGL